MLLIQARTSFPIRQSFQRFRNYSSTHSHPHSLTRHLLQAISCPTRANTIAIVDPQVQKTYTYGELCSASARLAHSLTHSLTHSLDHQPRTLRCIASYNKPGANYVITALAAWHLGATLVPLCVAHTAPEISYFVSDSGSDVVVYECGGEAGVQHLDVPTVCIDEDYVWKPDTNMCKETETPQSLTPFEFNIPEKSSDALILYTSGTSGAPKGCVHTHNGLTHMITSLVDSWEYTSSDKILHFLPLHHLHGVLNKLWCTLYAGGEVEFMKSADATSIWKRLSSHNSAFGRPPTIFMAVPTIYARLLEAAGKAVDSVQDGNKEASGLTLKELNLAVTEMHDMRVMISGSAALPDPVMAAWKQLTGHDLLERYGMSEIGMGLSNPLHGVRVPGTVGTPLPFVQCRLVDENEEEITVLAESGELRIKGPTVFKHYLNKEKATKETFDVDGWFKTGDIAIRENISDDELNEVRYRILGRSSTDIIKSGGYKLSALEIERELLAHPQVAEVAVIGQSNEMYGEVVTAIVVPKAADANQPVDIDSVSECFELTGNLKEFLNARLARYKQPRVYHMVKRLPRNLMGKVNKKTLLKDLQLDKDIM